MIVTLDLTGNCPCGRPVRGVQTAEAKVLVRSVRLIAGLAVFAWCEAADRNHPKGHGTPTNVRGVLTEKALADIAERREALRARNARRRQAVTP